MIARVFGSCPCPSITERPVEESEWESGLSASCGLESDQLCEQLRKRYLEYVEKGAKHRGGGCCKSGYLGA